MSRAVPAPGPGLRVLLVTHNYPRVRDDPAGAFLHTLAAGCARLGVAVRVLAPHDRTAALSEETDGVEIRRFRYGPAALERVAYAGLGSPSPGWLLRAGMLPAFLRRFRRALAEELVLFRPHVVHAHWWFPAGAVTPGFPTPVILTSHGSDVRLLEGIAPLRPWARRIYRRAAAATAVSQFLARDLQRLLGRDVGPIRVTPMPVAVPASTARPERAVPPRILFVGNLVRSKGVDVLVRAFALLRTRGIDTRLRVVGAGPERPRLERLARKLGVLGEVEWAGARSRAETWREYPAATVTVLPSRGKSEGLGLVLVESLLAGTPVVGTAVGGIPEVVRHEETGLLARDDDPAGLADQLRRMLEDPALREATVARGQVLVRARHDPSAVARAMTEFYRDVVDG